MYAFIVLFRGFTINVSFKFFQCGVPPDAVPVLAGR
jgi:hypothetical protein